MDFTMSDGSFTKFTTSSDSSVPSQLYTNWCAQLDVTSASAGLDGDDTGWIIRVTPAAKVRALGTTDKIGFSAEGSFEIFKNEPSGSSSVALSVSGVNRAYTTNAGVPRMCINFHPNYDAGSIGVKRAQNEDYFLIAGVIQRQTGPAVDFFLKLEYGVGFMLALKVVSGTIADLPVSVFEIGANNSHITQQSLVASLSSTDPETLIINGDYRYGTLSGTVINEAGVPAERDIRCYDRASGQLLYKTQSNSGGTYTIPALTAGEMYVVALDDDIAPSLNALIFDRITYN